MRHIIESQNQWKNTGLWFGTLFGEQPRWNFVWDQVTFNWFFLQKERTVWSVSNKKSKVIKYDLVFRNCNFWGKWNGLIRVWFFYFCYRIPHSLSDEDWS